MKNFGKVIITVIFYSISLDANSQGISGYLMKAEALIQSGKMEEAIDVLSNAPGHTGDHRLLLKRADIYIGQGDLSSAINDLNEANKLKPFSGEYALSKVYALKGDVQTSLYHLERNLGSAMKVSEKDILLETAFNPFAKKPEWKLFWSKDRYSSPERMLSEIEFYTSAGKNDQAGELLQQLRTEYPRAEDAVMYAESMISYAASRYEVAVKNLTQLSGRYPENMKYLLLLAKSQEGSSNAASATNTYTMILDAGTSDAGILLARAEAYRKTGETEKALADIDEYLVMYPDDSRALSFSGKLHAISGDNLKAIEIFNRNLQLHPQNANLYIDRANSYFSARSWLLASNDYSMALDLDPGNPDAWLNKGISLINSGKILEGCHDLRKALSLGNKRASELINRNCIR